jgi:hypothetical protein
MTLIGGLSIVTRQYAGDRRVMRTWGFVAFAVAGALAIVIVSSY